MFRDRPAAGARLARELSRYRGADDALIVAVPRGGLPIAGVLARELALRLDVVVTKKIGHPDDPELAIGAVSLTDEAVDSALVARESISRDDIAWQIERVRAALHSRYRMYHGISGPLSVIGKTVILADDGAATGRTMLVAIDLLRRQGALKIVAALPVAPRGTVEILKKRADEVVCLEAPDDFTAISRFYTDFSRVTDEEALRILKDAA
ncbi:MAG: phosphoribosyltransferase [Elusimicrobia bacterium]|nr:phosphoribosyltransferase [Elusimicrobiota bacterium]